MPRKKQEELDDDGQTLTLEREKVRIPRHYVVWMHNDDYTTQEFVVSVLVKFFYKSTEEAAHLMMTVHLQGKARVGIFTKDLAETKINQVTAYARENDMPLVLTAEPE